LCEIFQDDRSVNLNQNLILESRTQNRTRPEDFDDLYDQQPACKKLEAQRPKELQIEEERITLGIYIPGSVKANTLVVQGSNARTRGVQLPRVP
jgi:hypothetical protein